MLGPKVAEIEDTLTCYVGVPQGIRLASGTDSLEIALRALGIGPGREIITCPPGPAAPMPWSWSVPTWCS